MKQLPDIINITKSSESTKDQLIVELSGRINGLAAQNNELATQNNELAERIIELGSQIAEQQNMIIDLQGKLALNSSNSGKPPSTDGFKKVKNTSTREKGRTNRGGQAGHQGNTLFQSDTPDTIEQHRPPTHCDCGAVLSELTKVETRQVFDIPPIKPIVIEHQIFEAKCSCGKLHKAAFPVGVEGTVQYGPTAKAIVVGLTCHEMLPVRRTGKLMGTLFDLPMSDAAVLNAQNEAAVRLMPAVEAIANALKIAPVLHADETGMNVAGKNKWLHVAATETLVCMGAHDKRGKEAFDALGI